MSIPSTEQLERLRRIQDETAAGAARARMPTASLAPALPRTRAARQPTGLPATEGRASTPQRRSHRPNQAPRGFASALTRSPPPAGCSAAVQPVRKAHVRSTGRVHLQQAKAGPSLRVVLGQHPGAAAAAAPPPPARFRPLRAVPRGACPEASATSAGQNPQPTAMQAGPDRDSSRREAAGPAGPQWDPVLRAGSHHELHPLLRVPPVAAPSFAPVPGLAAALSLPPSMPPLLLSEARPCRAPGVRGGGGGASRGAAAASRVRVFWDAYPWVWWRRPQAELGPKIGPPPAPVAPAQAVGGNVAAGAPAAAGDDTEGDRGEKRKKEKKEKKEKKVKRERHE